MIRSTPEKIAPPLSIAKQLETHGFALLPKKVQGETLLGMQRAFAARLDRLRWNNFDGYERTERFRLMVQDILTLDQGFVSIALDEAVKEALRTYLGPCFQMVEAKGWRSLPTSRMFHGWHGDAWYDQNRVSGIPREVKLGLYLTDVRTGGFRYLGGTHRQYQPRDWKSHEIEALGSAGMIDVTGAAGTAFLFDTSGIHGQSCPILEPRHAVFYNFHDPSVPLQRGDVEHYRYHPLALNAAFLGNLTAEDQAILGFGDQTNLQAAFDRPLRHRRFQSLCAQALEVKIVSEEFISRVAARTRRVLSR